MRFEPIIITEDQNRFEFHLKDFLTYNWPETIFSIIPVSQPRCRYEFANSFKETPEFGEAGDTICEIETMPVGENRLELRIAAIELGETEFHQSFFISLFEWLYKKWLPEQYIEEYENYLTGGMLERVNPKVSDPIGSRIKEIEGDLHRRYYEYDSESNKWVSKLDDSKLPEEFRTEEKRRLPPPEVYEEPNRIEKLDTKKTNKLKGGRPPLEHEEVIYRLAKAQEAREIRKDDPSRKWKDIAKDINWQYGTREKGVKLLEDACRRLDALMDDDPDSTLDEVKDYRRKEKNG